MGLILSAIAFFVVAWAVSVFETDEGGTFDVWGTLIVTIALLLGGASLMTSFGAAGLAKPGEPEPRTQRVFRFTLRLSVGLVSAGLLTIAGVALLFLVVWD